MQNNLPEKSPNISKVIQEDMCVACGACLEVCPYKNLAACYSNFRATHEVGVLDEKKCYECDKPCDSVCPSVEVDYKKLSKTFGHAERKIEDRLGPINKVWIGYSSRYQMDGVSSSGGILREIVSSWLSHGKQVVCLVSNTNDKYAMELVSEIDAIYKIPGSIYHSVSLVDTIACIKKAKTKVLLVGIPCQIEGVAKYVSEHEPALGNKLGPIVGIICGWMFTSKALSAFCQYKNINGKIDDAKYRGENESGFLKLKIDGVVHKFERRKFEGFTDRHDYRSSFGFPANRLRCRVCQNHVNVLADISVGDAWLRRKRLCKESIVIERTIQGKEMINTLRNRGNLVLEQGDVSDIFESQSSNLVNGIVARKLTIFLQNSGLYTPSFTYHDDQKDCLAIGLSDTVRFKFELYLRKTLRDERYFLYRKLYTIYIFFRWFNRYSNSACKRIQKFMMTKK